jgi:hypothetical protein
MALIALDSGLDNFPHPKIPLVAAGYHWILQGVGGCFKGLHQWFAYFKRVVAVERKNCRILNKNNRPAVAPR